MRCSNLHDQQIVVINRNSKKTQCCAYQQLLRSGKCCHSCVRSELCTLISGSWQIKRWILRNTASSVLNLTNVAFSSVTRVTTHAEQQLLIRQIGSCLGKIILVLLACAFDFGEEGRQSKCPAIRSSVLFRALKQLTGDVSGLRKSLCKEKTVLIRFRFETFDFQRRRLSVHSSGTATSDTRPCASTPDNIDMDQVLFMELSLAISTNPAEGCAVSRLPFLIFG